jgi:hypothetical protein
MANEKYGIELEMDTGDAERKLEELERRISALAGSINVSSGGAGGGISGASGQRNLGQNESLLQGINKKLDFLMTTINLLGHAALPATFAGLKNIASHETARQRTVDQFGLAGLDADKKGAGAEVNRAYRMNLAEEQGNILAEQKINESLGMGVGKVSDVIALPATLIRDLINALIQLRDGVLTFKGNDPVTNDRK